MTEVQPSSYIHPSGVGYTAWICKTSPTFHQFQRELGGVQIVTRRGRALTKGEGETLESGACPACAESSGRPVRSHAAPGETPVEQLVPPAIARETASGRSATSRDAGQALKVLTQAPNGKNPVPSMQTLARTDLFGGLTRGQLRLVASMSRCRDYPEGATLFLKGDKLDSLYVIEEGAVSLSIDVRLWNREVALRTIMAVVGTGESFGWSALVEPNLATLSAHTLRPCKLVVIPSRQLMRVLAKHTDMGFKVMTSVGTLVSRRLNAVTASVASERAIDVAKQRWGF